MTRLHELAGLSTSNPEALKHLTAYACTMLKARVRLSAEFWAEQDGTEQAALLAAGQILDVRQARRFGLCAQGGLDALKVEAELDGGAAHDEALLEFAVGQLATQMEAARNAR